MMRRSRLLLAIGALTAAAVMLPVSVAGCGTEDESIFGPVHEAEGGIGDLDGNFFAPNPINEAGTQCTTGKACGDAGVCAGNVCCTAAKACGDVCCGTSDVCSFGKCATPGPVCNDSSECATGQYCEFTLGTSTDGGTADGGAPDSSCVSGVVRTGRCLPRPPDCAPDAGASGDAGVTCIEKCEYRPNSTFTPVQKFAWGGVVAPPYNTDVMMAPIVIELDDDDCDGKVTERDIPEIVFSTFTSGAYSGNGQLHAISIVGGAFVEKWTIPNAVNTTVVNPTKQIAAGNFDGKPGNEVVACGVDGKLHAFKGTDGSELWASPVLAQPTPPPAGGGTPNTTLCFMPSIADLDGDGTVEVIVEGAILNGADGTIKHLFVPPLNGPFVVSDLDSDGKLDIITSSRGYHADGLQFVDTNLATFGSFPGTQDWKGAWPGVGDFNGDGKPEVVVADNDTHQLMVWRYDAAATNKFTVVRPLIDMNAQFDPMTNSCPMGSWGNLHGGGPPTVADFDKDGVPDVGLAGGIGYVVFNGKKLVDPANFTGLQSILWSKVTTDCSSASTGSTVFDFDGDGKAEVVYSDQKRMRIYDGATGTELASFCNTTATLVEFPLVADVDNDGHADIIVASNAYGETCVEPVGGAVTRQAGIRVFGDTQGAWVRTRRVWNEHAYHITNVNEDGTIPKNELPNWKQPGLNNFRQNKQPGSEFAAPNLVASLAPICPGPTGVTVTVRNIGEAVVPADVYVGVYAGTPPSGVKIGTVRTTRPLYPAESEPLELITSGPPPPSVYAVVDDGAAIPPPPPHPSWTECRTNDNTTQAVSTACSAPK